MRISKTLLARLVFEIDIRIQAAVEAKEKYDFMQIKKTVLDSYFSDHSYIRKEYSKLISKHFGKKGGKKGAEKAALSREAKKKNRLQLMISEAWKIQISEAMRAGFVQMTEEGDIVMCI